MERLSSTELVASVGQLDDLIEVFERVKVTEDLVRGAGQLAQDLSLRGYDAVHLAASQSIASDDTAFISNDLELNVAAVALGLNVVAL